MHLKHLLIALCLLVPGLLSAQFAINPQVGISFQSLTNTPDQLEAKANLGWLVGSDFRIGDRLYLQPGLFFSRVVTAVTVGDSAMIEDDLIRSYGSIKMLGGFNLIHEEGFRLRVNGGVSYDLLMSVDNKDDELQFEREDFSDGVWNSTVGVGVDLLFLTMETGAVFGLSELFSDEVMFDEEVKHLTWYLTVGCVIGGSPD